MYEQSILKHKYNILEVPGQTPKQYSYFLLSKRSCSFTIIVVAKKGCHLLSIKLTIKNMHAESSY